MEQQIVIKAREWLNTPFKHQGRLKNIGCDCLGLIMGIANELNLTTKFGQPLSQLDTNNYKINANGFILKNTLAQQLQMIAQPKSGTLALMEFDNNPAHLAILCDNPNYQFGIIHAHISSKMVVEHGLSPEYQSKIKSLYQLTSKNYGVSAWHQ